MTFCWLLFLGFFIFSTALLAQKPSDFSGKYRQHEKVILDYAEIVKIFVDGDNLSVTSSVSEKTYFPGNRYNGNLKERVIYEPEFDRVSDVEGFTLVPNFKKDKYKKEKISKPDDIKLISASVFHDGTRAKSFEFEQITQGAITQLEYSKEHLLHQLLGRAMFASSYLMLNKTFTLQLHPKVNIVINYINCSAASFDIDTSLTDNGLKTITWTKTNLAPYDRVFGQPSIISTAPHIVYRIESFHTESGAEKTVLANIKDVFLWNQRNYEKADNTFSAELKKITTDLLADAPTEEVKAQRIYQWVNENISYVAFEDGMGGFQPRGAAAVCTKRFGDCKDMANLMVQMMRYVGLDAAPVWIGTRSLPYKYSEIPAPYVANHMICALRLKDSLYFLDATNKGLPFGYPSIFIQGKEGLVSKGSKDYEVATVPIIKAHLNRDVDSNWVHLIDGNLKGTGKNVMTGLVAFEINSMLAGKNLKELGESATTIYQKAAPRSNSTLIQFERDDYGSTVEYEFDITRFGDQVSDFHYLNLNIDQPLKSFAVDRDRKVALDLERCSQIEKHLAFTIPKGYEIDFLPENGTFSHPDFGYHIQYRKTASHIYYDLVIHWNKLMIHPQEFKQWNEFINSLSKEYQQSIVLHKV